MKNFPFRAGIVVQGHSNNNVVLRTSLYIVQIKLQIRICFGGAHYSMDFVLFLLKGENCVQENDPGQLDISSYQA